MNNYMWLVLIPNLDCFFGAIGIIGFIACIIGGIFYLDKISQAYDDTDKANARKFGREMLKVLAISMSIMFITCFIPNKKDIIQLKALSIVSELNGVDQIPQKLVDKLNVLLDEVK